MAAVKFSCRRHCWHSLAAVAAASATATADGGAAGAAVIGLVGAVVALLACRHSNVRSFLVSRPIIT